MSRFKAPDFNERSAAARTARQSALEKLRNKPAPDSAVVAERQAVHAARKAAAAERRAARQGVAEPVDAAEPATVSKEAELEPEAVVATPERPAPSAEELKAARDARYAARKARKR